MRSKKKGINLETHKLSEKLVFLSQDSHEKRKKERT